MKHFRIMFFAVLSTIIMTTSAFASSSSWYQENGNWKVKDISGAPLVNTWFCDDTDEQNPWYLLDCNGNMVTGLAQDIFGNYYSLETTPGDNYGKMRHKNGFYDGVYLEFNSSGAIKNLKNIASFNGFNGIYLEFSSSGNTYRTLYGGHITVVPVGNNIIYDSSLYMHGLFANIVMNTTKSQ